MTAALSADGKTLTITASDAFASGDNVTFTDTAVKDIDGTQTVMSANSAKITISGSAGALTTTIGSAS